MRALLGLVAFVSCVVLGCAHVDDHALDQASTAPLLRGDARVHVASLEDVPLGRYRGVYGPTDDVTLTRVADHLVLESATEKSSGLNVSLVLRDDGAFAVPGHTGAWLTKRDGKTFLTVAYCYLFAVYELAT